MSRYVEDKYKLEIGNAQNTQLSRALATGTEKGVFVMPKGMCLDRIYIRGIYILSPRIIYSGASGRVKLPPKAARAETSATKEVT